MQHGKRDLRERKHQGLHLRPDRRSYLKNFVLLIKNRNEQIKSINIRVFELQNMNVPGWPSLTDSEVKRKVSDIFDLNYR